MVKIGSDYIKRLYSFYSPFYDLIFGKVMENGRKKAIGMLDVKKNQKILEIGVGTGLTLDLYPPHCKITGIDISEKMIEQAKKRISKLKENNRKITFKVMDALNLEFEDETFDAVIASYVITTVNDPLKACQEMKRVCKKGGQIIVVNHSKSDNGFLGKVEEFISPFCWKVGFATNVNVIEPLRSSGVDIYKTITAKPFKLYKVIQGARVEN